MSKIGRDERVCLVGFSSPGGEDEKARPDDLTLDRLPGKFTLTRTRLCLHLQWRPGDTVSATDWQPAMEGLWSHPTIAERLWLNRGDVGFGQEGIQQPCYQGCHKSQCCGRVGHNAAEFNLPNRFPVTHPNSH